MPGFDVKTLSDLSDQIRSWEDQFVGETSFKRYQRAAAWAMDESAKSMAVGMREETPRVLDRPSPWTVRAFQYTRSLGKTKTLQDPISSDFYVLDDQSIVLKYLLGPDVNERRPGDVGLARNEILLPNFKNILKTRGVNANAYGNVPGGAFASIARDAETYKNSTLSRWGVWKGEITVHGSPVMAYIARPPRVGDPRGGATAFTSARGTRTPNRTVNLGRPRILFVAVDRATYRPVLQPVWDTLQREAVRRIPDLMAAELADGVAYKANQGVMR